MKNEGGVEFLHFTVFTSQCGERKERESNSGNDFRWWLIENLELLQFPDP